MILDDWWLQATEVASYSSTSFPDFVAQPYSLQEIL
jgi:hypothetical protein